MPFAKKFRAMMDFPFVGDTVGGFIVEHIDVRDTPLGSGRYTYSVRMVLHGPGGQPGVRRALKALFSAHPVTFSGYGNPYQLWVGKPEVESLGDQRYAVSVEGAGARVFLEDELQRFLEYLAARGQLATEADQAAQEALAAAYVEQYQGEIRRKVARYQSRQRKAETAVS